MVATHLAGKIRYVTNFIMAYACKKKIGIADIIRDIFDRDLKCIHQIDKIGFCYLVFPGIDEADLFPFALEIGMESIAAAYSVGIGIVMTLDDYIIEDKQIGQFHFTLPRYMC